MLITKDIVADLLHRLILHLAVVIFLGVLTNNVDHCIDLLVYLVQYPNTFFVVGTLDTQSGVKERVG